MSPVRITADLRVEIAGPQGQTARGHLHGTDNLLTFDIDHPGMFAGNRDAPTIRAVAQEMYDRRLRVRVVHDGVHLVTIGDVLAPWWQRRATGSKRIRIGTWKGAWTSLRSRAGDQPAVLPTAKAFPPVTMMPIAPTLHRGRRRPVTTTHDPHGTGEPRLALEKDAMWAQERQSVWILPRGETTIGSGAGCDLVLPGLSEHHATVVHDEHDEYVLLAHADVRVHGAPVLTQVLRSGSRIELGSHTLSYYRDESSDHGRPYGGRSGGEAGRQRPQPPRRSTTDRQGSAD